MQSTHIFLVILVTVFLIIFAEYQKLRKIKWILLIGCVTYILLSIAPKKALPISGEYEETNFPRASDIADQVTIIKPEIIDKIIFNELKSSNEMQNLVIPTIAIAIDIIDKTPVGVSRLFLNNVNKLFCFTAVYNPSKNNKIIHNWKYNGQDYSKIAIEVGNASYWRCWSRITIRPDMAGEWQVVITDTVGNFLDLIEFSIIPARE